jgi:hypothetical protein
MTFLLGDKVLPATKGSLVYIPSTTVYSAKVESEGAHCLNIHTKSGFDEFIKYIGTPGNGQQRVAPKEDFVEKIVDAGCPFATLEEDWFTRTDGWSVFTVYIIVPYLGLGHVCVFPHDARNIDGINFFCCLSRLITSFCMPAK